ncbi:unnamed protein product [Bathycoccus prasinos]
MCFLFVTGMLDKVYSFENIVTAGVNSVIYAGIPLDYLFVFDKGKKVYRGKRDSSWLENPEAFDAFECRIQKFYGYFKRSPNFGPPIRSNSGAKLIEGYVQLEDHALDNHRNKKGIKAMLKEWKVAYDFIGNEYSNVNITVLNPIGLKGMGWREIYDIIEIFTEISKLETISSSSGPDGDEQIYQSYPIRSAAKISSPRNFAVEVGLGMEEEVQGIFLPKQMSFKTLCFYEELWRKVKDLKFNLDKILIPKEEIYKYPVLNTDVPLPRFSDYKDTRIKDEEKRHLLKYAERLLPHWDLLEYWGVVLMGTMPWGSLQVL